MKLSQEIKDQLLGREADPESAHSYFDDVVLDRLRELDPEFVAELEELTKDFTFWYA
jgi:hypothetical protein